VPEFIAYVKANPGRLSYASTNAIGLVAGATLKRMAGLDLVHVPYRSSPQAINDVMTGRLAMMFVDFALGSPQAAKLVRRRGELMQRAGEDRPGTMAAVLGLPTKEVEAACAEASQQASVAVAANINAPDQTVISGDPDAVTRAGEACKKRGAKRVIPLKVSGAFHSPLMGPATNHLQLALERAEFHDPQFPVIANATAENVKDAGRARRLLADQLTVPVRWVECMEHAAKMGGEDGRFIEIGPGQVLAGLLKRIVTGAIVLGLHPVLGGIR
jgi:[acyl-carrier-protein] S-malonyltransferase